MNKESLLQYCRAVSSGIDNLTNRCAELRIKYPGFSFFSDPDAFEYKNSISEVEASINVAAADADWKKIESKIHLVLSDLKYEDYTIRSSISNAIEQAEKDALIANITNITQTIANLSTIIAAG